MVSTTSPLLLLLKIYFLVSECLAADSSDGGTELLDKLVSMKNRAFYWLSSQRKEDFSWGTDTARVILAISAADDIWPQKNDLEAMLIAKQLEVELLAKLLRYSEEPIPPARIGYYALALNAICKDPRNYYGHNLVGLLEKHVDDFEYPGYPETFGFSLSSLVSCLGGSHLHRRQIHNLMKISQDDTRLHSVETRAMALLTLKCVYEHRPLEMIERLLHEGYEALGALQKPDGSFGNIHTTALIIQGLGLDENFAEYWNDTRWIVGLAASQNLNGSFEDSVLGTADALLAISTLLNGAGILKLKRHHCSTYTYTPLEGIMNEVLNVSPVPFNDTSTWNNSNVTLPDILKGPPTVATSLPLETTVRHLSSDPSATPDHQTELGASVETTPQSLPTQLLVKYTLWIGQDPITAEKHNLTMSVPVNTSFFHLMQRAAEMDPAFEFTSTVWPNGHYVHTISGHREQPVGYNYWLLYRLPSDPDPVNPPPTTYVAEKGVDNLLVSDGDIYLFWFKKI